MEKNIIFSFFKLEDEAENEVYPFIEKNLKPLPKKPDGSIDRKADEFQHTDVDVLRHAYVSGVFTIERGEKIANIPGWAREFSPWSSIGSSRPGETRSRNMDLWNNSVGRKYGKKAKTRKGLFQLLLKTLKKCVPCIFQFKLSSKLVV